MYDYVKASGVIMILTQGKLDQIGVTNALCYIKHLFGAIHYITAPDIFMQV